MDGSFKFVIGAFGILVADGEALKFSGVENGMPQYFTKYRAHSDLEWLLDEMCI
jgi:hypothetical protein